MKRGVLQAGRAAIASRVAPPPAAVTAPPKMYALKRKAPVRRAPSVVCEGKDWLVLNKPSNTALQGAHGTTARRNWDELLQDIQQRAESPEVYPVHRLDKATTGTLLLAKSKLQAKRFATAFKTHQVQRTYLAVAHGAIKPGYEDEITAPVRVDDDLVRLANIDEEGAMEARTRWKCLSSSAKFSLLSLSPLTGRKHQLRVHCAQVLQAPIVGDFKYGITSPLDSLSAPSLPSDTVLLHAHTISFFTFDKSGKRRTVEATAEPPASFAAFCKKHGLELPR